MGACRGVAADGAGDALTGRTDAQMLPTGVGFSGAWGEWRLPHPTSFLLTEPSTLRPQLCPSSV